MDEAGDLLVRREPERIEHAAVIGIPFGDPGGAEAQRLGGDEQVHGGGAGGEHLLPFRDLHVGRGAAHDRDHQRRAGEPGAFVRDMFLFGVGVFGDEGGGDGLAGLLPRLALEHDEAPGGELAVVGYPGGDGQQGLEFRRRRAWCAKLVGLSERRLLRRSMGSGIHISSGMAGSGGSLAHSR